MDVIEHKGAQWYAQLAERACEQALAAIQRDEDASAELSLAQVAWKVVMGDASDAERVDMNEYVLTDDGGYEIDMGGECICPPELIARNDGSFRGGCPVHA